MNSDVFISIFVLAQPQISKDEQNFKEKLKNCINAQEVIFKFCYLVHVLMSEFYMFGTLLNNCIN